MARYNNIKYTAPNMNSSHNQDGHHKQRNISPEGRERMSQGGRRGAEIANRHKQEKKEHHQHSK
jgi:hypothetical protein